MKKIIEGLSKIRGKVFPQHQELFGDLASTPSPEALLITCTDSRIDPTLLTQPNPGDLLIVRNVGNMVPAFSQAFGDVTARIEYAVMVLGVKNIIICGHSDCRAMGSVLHPERVAKMKHVAAWLHYGEPARLVVEQKYSYLSGDRLLMALTEQNVLAQLNNLRTHPAVTAGLAKGELRLHGWVYEIGTGEVTSFDPSKDCFMPLRHVGAAVGDLQRCKSYTRSAHPSREAGACCY